jgi:hypothetical protein
MLPTDVQEIWLEVDAVRIHCLTAGQSGSPPRNYCADADYQRRKRS